ncbi:hypothetical protein B0H17DRAFT_1052474, partial [Mycena rosella]
SRVFLRSLSSLTRPGQGPHALIQHRTYSLERRSPPASRVHPASRQPHLIRLRRPSGHGKSRCAL